MVVAEHLAIEAEATHGALGWTVTVHSLGIDVGISTIAINFIAVKETIIVRRW